MGALETQDGVAHRGHGFASLCAHTSRNGTLLDVSRINPQVAISPNDEASRMLLASVLELHDVVLHASDEVRVGLEQEPVGKLAVLLITRLQRDLAICRVDLHDLS